MLISKETKIKAIDTSYYPCVLKKVSIKAIDPHNIAYDLKYKLNVFFFFTH
jgi:hypothetical protein